MSNKEITIGKDELMKLFDDTWFKALELGRESGKRHILFMQMLEGFTKKQNDDLINVPEEHTVWVNIQKAHKEGLEPGLAVLHKNRMIADNYAVNRIACIPVTYKEGEGL